MIFILLIHLSYLFSCIFVFRDYSNNLNPKESAEEKQSRLKLLTSASFVPREASLNARPLGEIFNYSDHHHFFAANSVFFNLLLLELPGIFSEF